MRRARVLSAPFGAPPAGPCGEIAATATSPAAASGRARSARRSTTTSRETKPDPPPTSSKPQAPRVRERERERGPAGTLPRHSTDHAAPHDTIRARCHCGSCSLYGNPVPLFFLFFLFMFFSVAISSDTYDLPSPLSVSFFFRDALQPLRRCHVLRRTDDGHYQRGTCAELGLFFVPNTLRYQVDPIPLCTCTRLTRSTNK